MPWPWNAGSALPAVRGLVPGRRGLQFEHSLDALIVKRTREGATGRDSLLHMETLFQHVAPILEQVGQAGNLDLANLTAGMGPTGPAPPPPNPLATALSNNDGHRGRRRCIRRRLGKPAGGQFPALVLLRRQAQRCHPIQASTWLGRARQARAHRSRSMVFRGAAIAFRLAH